MNAEQVVQKIVSQARAEADKILAAAREAAGKEKQRLDQELGVFAGDARKAAEAAGQDKLARMLAAARMQNARELLAAKGQVLDELFARVKQRIEQMPDGEYLELMKRLLHKSVQTGQEEVIVGRHEGRINQDFLNRINGELAGQGKGHLHLSSTREDISGGFILSSGKVRINASVDVLVAQLRDAMEMQLTAELFE
ncbi:MAG TPA: V-type ATP synthase subunit E [Anaerohalosphaeraceae bacterium]|nr:V-type ATP synthase subunit E [Anaerohalosphaeraceae bacterium]